MQIKIGSEIISESFLLAKCIQEIKKHGKIHFDAYFVTMDPGYKNENRNKIIDKVVELKQLDR